MADPACEFAPAVFDRKWLELFGLGGAERGRRTGQDKLT
jgi:hypothetical protein